MKAWKGTVGDGIGIGWLVVWADTPTQAKGAVKREMEDWGNEVEYPDVRVRRAALLDGEPKVSSEVSDEELALVGITEEE